MLAQKAMVLALVLPVAVAGCTSSGDPCTPPTGPVEANCQAFSCGPTLSSAWLSGQIASGTCSPTPPALAGQLYASCTPANGGSTPSLCTGLAAGQQLCVGLALTALCQNDADCPNGTRCYPQGIASFGTCEKTCSAAGNGECGRCDRACDTTAGLCVAVGPGYPTNTPCDATHPAIAVTLVLPEGFMNATLAVSVPGSDATIVHLLPGTTVVTLPYPPGSTAGAGSVAFSGDGPGIDLLGGEATFPSDPSACTAVTVEVHVTSGPPDAGT